MSKKLHDKLKMQNADKETMVLLHEYTVTTEWQRIHAGWMYF